MRDHYCRSFRALGRCLIVCAALFGGAYAVDDNAIAQPLPQVAKPNPTQDLAPALSGIQKAVEGIASAIEAAKADPEADQKRERDIGDLEAQRDMAKWAFWMLIATAFSAMFTGIGVILIAFTLKYTKDTLTEAKAATKAANDTVTVTRQIGEDQLRPYVHISAARFYWDHIGPRAIVSCQNSGQTPATFFEIRFHTRAIPVGDEREFIQPPDDVKPLPWPAMGGTAPTQRGFTTSSLRLRPISRVEAALL